MINQPAQLAIVLLIIVLTDSFSAHGQKLPDTQQISLYAPAAVKIDVKTTEWQNHFQAYNKATSIYYTLANDGDNLYLAIQAKDPVIIRKILSGNIIFAVNRSAKKDDEHVALTLPLLPDNIPGQISSYHQQRVALAPGKINKIYERDSLLLLMNTTLLNSFKLIKVKGIKSLPDTILSVYNENGIQAKALFDTDNALTCELAIPIKYLQLSGTPPFRFSYQIKLNGLFANSGIAIGFDGSLLPAGSYTVVYSGPKIERETLMNTTNFWGEYTLAGK